MRTVVIGGSAAGLVASLLLARAGHDVEVFDRDQPAPAADAETAAETAFRPAAPQVVHLHGYQPPLATILRARLPDVYDALLDAGAVTAPLADRMPPTLSDRAPRPGDERYSGLLARRSTLDWVLQTAAAAQPGLRVTGHLPVTGLLARPGEPPTVVGVRTGRGAHPADLVVDASGRRSRTDGWLADIGARAPETTFAECGAAYYYRVRPGVGHPVLARHFHLGLLRFFSVIMVAGDRGTRSITIAPLVEDHPMRRLRDPAVFGNLVRTIPPLAALPDVLDPISDVQVMGGLHNTLRRLVVDGSPVVLGLHTVGDAVCTTNPVGGRGMTLALQTAVDLTDALAAHPDDPWAQALAMDDAVSRGIVPWYAAQAGGDSERLAATRRALRGEPAAPPPGITGAVTLNHLRRAAMTDPELFRSLSSVLTMLRTPAEVLADVEVEDRVRAAFAAGDLPGPQPEPSRADLLACLGEGP